MDDEIRNDIDDVAENATSETEKEQTEQRTDDYNGIVRRLDDAISKIDMILDRVDEIKGLYSTFVDAGAIVGNATDAVAAAAADGIADVIDTILDLEALDYSL